MRETSGRVAWAAGLLAWLVPLGASAQAPAAVTMEGECAAPEPIRDAAAAEITDVEARVSVAVACGDPVDVEVRVALDGEAPLARRIELPAGEVATMPEAVGLIVAVAVAEWREARAVAPVAPTPVWAPPALADDATPSAPRPTPRRPAAGPTHRFDLALGAHLGPQEPAGWLGGELALAWRTDLPLYAEVGLAAWIPRTAAVREGEVQVWRWSARASACAGGTIAGPFRLGGCAGLDAGAVQSRASGFGGANRVRRDPWVALDLRARGQVALGAAFVRAEVRLAVPLWSPTLVVASSNGGRVAELAFGSALGAGVLSVGAHFSP
ncbi:MAG TPA: hypothetical protein RMH99_08205 [Sandaracinaceae bacterium LLY-WYZ-13_1]|nr:hypothetical protein [Sandaracinaceae bacterium LLY-WYZ-13_1]